jgi:hypothetical protein
MGAGEVHTRFWWERPEGKKPLGRHRHRGEDNIKLDFQDVEWGDMDWIDLAQDTDR